MTVSAAEEELEQRLLHLREPSLTHFTEDREREDQGGVDEKRQNEMRNTDCIWDDVAYCISYGQTINSR